MDGIPQMIVLCTLILTTGGVLILRPLSRRLGVFLDAMTEAKLRATPEVELTRIREVLSSIDGRLDQIEERQDFAEALITTDPKLLTGAPMRPERN